MRRIEERTEKGIKVEDGAGGLRWKIEVED